MMTVLRIKFVFHHRCKLHGSNTLDFPLKIGEESFNSAINLESCFIKVLPQFGRSLVIEGAYSDFSKSHTSSR